MQMIFAEALYPLEDHRALYQGGADPGPGEYHRVWKDTAVNDHSFEDNLDQLFTKNQKV